MLSIAADERAALQFEDLASALDAGLPLHSIAGADPKNERAIHEALRHRGVVLSATEDAVLLAAWRTGRVTDALRARGTERRRRAEFRRSLWAGLRYPLTLVVLLLVASAVTVPVMGHAWFPVGVVTAIVAVTLFALAARRGLANGDERWIRMPVLGPIVGSLAELPYLETLHSMYAAGVPLLQAHTAAVAAVPVTSVKNRLRIADGVLQGGRSLTDSLAQALALHPETRVLLATGERAGQLEDALQRALARRRDVASRSINDTARRATTLVTIVVMLSAAAIIVSFYSGYYAKIRGVLGK